MPITPAIRTGGGPKLEIQVERGNRAESFALNVAGTITTSPALSYPCIQPGTWTSELTSDGFVNEAFQLLFTGYTRAARDLAEILHTARESAYSTRNRVRLLWNETDADGNITALLTCVVVDGRMAALDYNEVINRMGANSADARIYAVSITHTAWEYNIDNKNVFEPVGGPNDNPTLAVKWFEDMTMANMYANPVVGTSVESREARLKSMFIKPTAAGGQFRRLWLGWRRFTHDDDTDIPSATQTNFTPQVSLDSVVGVHPYTQKNVSQSDWIFFSGDNHVYQIYFTGELKDFSDWDTRVILSLNNSSTTRWNPNLGSYRFTPSYIGKYRLMAFLIAPANDEDDAIFGIRPRLIWYRNTELGNITDMGEQIVQLKLNYGRWVDLGEVEIGDWGFDVHGRLLPGRIALAWDFAVLGLDKSSSNYLSDLLKRTIVLAGVALLPAENSLYIELPRYISHDDKFGLEIIQDVYGNVRAFGIEIFDSDWRTVQHPQYLYTENEARPVIHFEATVQASDRFMLPINSAASYGSAKFSFIADKALEFTVPNDQGTILNSAKFASRLGVVPRYLGDIGHA